MIDETQDGRYTLTHDLNTSSLSFVANLHKANGVSTNNITINEVTANEIQLTHGTVFGDVVTGSSSGLLAHFQIVVYDAVPPSSECVDAPSGLLAWWPGENSADDVAGFNDGTMNGTYAAGFVGNAFDFGSTGNGVVVPDGLNLDPANISIGAWINIDQWITWASIINKRTSVNIYGFGLALNNTGGLQFQLRTTSGDGTLNGGALSEGQYHYVMATYNGSTMRIYIDGVSVASQPHTGAISVVNADLVIGRNIVTGDVFNGRIDEVEMYSRALSDSEIQSIYEAATEGKCPVMEPQCIQSSSGKISWWPGENSAEDVLGSNEGGSTATYTGGLVGRAFAFTQAGHQVTVPHQTSLNASVMTVDAWIKVDQWTTWASVIEKRTATNINGFSVGLNASGGIQFQIQTSSGVQSLNGGAITVGRYHHLAATYDGSLMSLYIDGVLVASTPWTGNINTTTASLVIGRNIVTPATFLGVIDEVEMYNRALSITEIQNIYNAGAAGQCR